MKSLLKFIALMIAVGFAGPAYAQLKPGFGAGVVVDFGGATRVKEATVVNGVVRVTSEDNASIRPMIDVHASIWPLGEKVKVGPFIGLQFSADQIVDSLGAGLMGSFKIDAGPAKSLNLGLGIVLDPNVRTLGNDIVEDQPLPPGETEIRFRNKAKFGILFMTSVGF